MCLCSVEVTVQDVLTMTCDHADRSLALTVLDLRYLWILRNPEIDNQNIFPLVINYLARQN